MGKGKKEKYYFDTSSFSVKKDTKSIKEMFFVVVSYVITGLAFAFFAIYFFTLFIDSPKEKSLKNELTELEIHYNYLNKRVENLSGVVDNIQQRDENLYRMIFEAEMPKYTAHLRNNYDVFLEYNLSDIVVRTSEGTDRLSNDLYSLSKSLDEVYDMAKNKEKHLQSIPAMYPINKHEGRFVSGFGIRMHPIYKVYRMHTGVDIAAVTGTPIYATGDGVVTVAANNPRTHGGYGICCVIDHGFGHETVYAHMSKLDARIGKQVKRGDVIGYVGTTGTSTGTHLHYEVKVNGKHVNPVNYFFLDLSPEEYLEILEKSKEINQSMS